MASDKDDEEYKKTLKELAERHASIAKRLEGMTHHLANLPSIPAFPSIPDVDDLIKNSPESIREKNAWKRHSEIVQLQDTFLRIQEDMLKELKFTSRLTKGVLVISVIAVMLALVALLLRA